MVFEFLFVCLGFGVARPPQLVAVRGTWADIALLPILILIYVPFFNTMFLTSPGAVLLYTVGLLHSVHSARRDKKALLWQGHHSVRFHRLVSRSVVVVVVALLELLLVVFGLITTYPLTVLATMIIFLWAIW